MPKRIVRCEKKKKYPGVTIFLLCRGCTVQGYCIKRHVWRVEEDEITDELVIRIRRFLAKKRAEGLTPAMLRRLLKTTYSKAKIRILHRRTKLEADLPIESLYMSEAQSKILPSLLASERDVQESDSIDFFRAIMTEPNGDVHLTSKLRLMCVATLIPVIWPTEWPNTPANDWP